MEEMIKLRDTLKEASDILDEFINLKGKEEEGKDITKDCESILGRFMLKMIELDSLQQ